jgi:Tfp pilus assembly protein PilX
MRTKGHCRVPGPCVAPPRRTRKASVLVLVVFVIALISAVTIGMLEIITEEVQLMQNYLYAAQAQATAEAGLHDALEELRQDVSWSAGFTDKPFHGGSYTVAVDGSTIQATGTTALGFVATVEAQVTVFLDGPPHGVTINTLRIDQ